MRYTPVKEQGAVLIVSLVMLSLATLIGVSGMSSAHLQERIAGNQKQGTDAFMAAETGVAAVIDAARAMDNWSDPDALVEGLGGMGPHPVSGQHPTQWRLAQAPEASGSAMSVVVVGGLESTTARRTLQITLENGLGGPHPEGAYHCFGSACAGRAKENFDLRRQEPVFDGRLWPRPDTEDGFTCKSGICPDNPPGTVEDALPLPDVLVTLEGLDADGNPSGTRADDWRDYVTQLVTHPERHHVLLDGINAQTVNGETTVGETVYAQDFMGSREDPRIHHVEGEGSIGLSGHDQGAGILVISDAVTLSPSNDTSVTFEGLVILLEGAQLAADQAKVNIFGAVVSLAGDDEAIFDDLSGNINIRYSPEALDNLREHGLWDAALEHPRITAWRELM